MTRLLVVSLIPIPSASAAAVQVVRTCEGFARNGHQVCLLVGDKPWEARGPGFEEFFGFEPSFRLTRRWRLPRTGIGFDRGAARWARDNADILYCRNLRIARAAALSGVKTVLEFHSMSYVGRDDWVRDALGSGNMIGWVSITEALRTALLDRYPAIDPDRVVVAADPVDPAPFEGAEPTQGANGRPRAGYFGSLYPGKGLELILPLAELLPEWEFDIYGGAPSDVARCSAQAPSNVRFHGFLYPKEIPAAILRTQVALLPNQPQVWVDGDDIGEFTSPAKLFEYMVAGRPIVASDLSVLREVLADGENSLLAPPDDPQVWADRLRSLAAEPAMAARLGLQARQDALTRYTHTERAKRIEGALFA